MMGVFRFFFLPEFGRSLGELRTSAVRVKSLCVVAFSPGPKGETCWRRAFERGGWLRASVGVALVGVGVGFAGVGIGGLVLGEAVAESHLDFDFSELDPFEADLEFDQIHFGVLE